jgi:N-acetylglucosaminyl-diphospho-decaprenol L-rhamnosyltransferase
VARRHGARALRLAENMGYACACNAGARAASGRWLFFLNPDVRIDRDAIAALAAAGERFADAGALAPQLIEPDGFLFYRDHSPLCPPPFNQGAPKRTPAGDCCAEMLAGAALLCRREAFFSIGGFDERIFLYYEDDDLFRRLRLAGWSLIHVHGARALHEGGKSTRASSAGMFFRSFHWAVSKCYVSRKHGIPFNPAIERWKAVARGCMAALRGAAERRERHLGLAAGYRAVIRVRRASPFKTAAEKAPQRVSEKIGHEHGRGNGEMAKPGDAIILGASR